MSILYGLSDIYGNIARADGSGRVAAVEVMIANPPVRSLIREGKIYQLPNIIRTHHDIGMVSLDESLAELYLEQVITYETALTFCRDSDELKKLIYPNAQEKKPRRS
ncbi:hypothetical protein ES703_93428 [subsurface metagenome]